MKKKSFHPLRLDYSLYRKFINLQNRIKLLMKSGEFFKLSSQQQKRFTRKLQILYNRMVRMVGKKKLRWATAIVVMLLSATISHAQYGEPEDLSGVAVYGQSRPTFADVDGDNDMDLVVGEMITDKLNYYENYYGEYREKLGSSNPFDGITDSVSLAPVMVDWDEDGDQDLLLGANGGTILFFTNTGGTFTEETGGSNPFNGVVVPSGAAPALFDIDEDDDYDLLVGDAAGGVHYFLNNSGTYVEQTGINNPFDGLSTSGNAMPAFADVDGDDDLDLTVGDTDGTLHYYINNGDGTYSVRLGSNNPFNDLVIDQYSAPAFHDVDDDGDLDLISGNNAGTVHYYTNSSLTFTEQFGDNNPFTGDVVVSSGMRANFIPSDASSGISLVSTDGSDSLAYFDYVDGRYVQQFDGDNPFDGLYVTGGVGATFVDLDGDDDLDIVMGNSNGRIHYVENDGGTYTELTGVDNPFNGIDIGDNSVPALGDFDGDDDIDMFVGEKSGIVNYYENIAGVFTLQSGVDNPLNGVDVGDYSAPTLADYDEDGDLDVFIGSKSSEVAYYRNTTGNLVNQTGANNPLNGITAGTGITPSFFDIDEDGDADCFLGNSQGKLFFLNYLNPNIVVETPNPLETSESGTSTTVNVSLETAPTALVTVPINVGDATEGMAVPAELEFTIGNWDVPQLVTIIGQDDSENDGDQTYTINIGPSTSADPNYNDLSAESLEVTNLDDDEPNVIDNNNIDQLSVYTYDKILVLESNKQIIEHVEIYNLMGSMVYNENIGTSGRIEIQLSELNKGMYIVHTYTEDDVLTSKVMIR